MSWPGITDFSEAIQSPQLCFKGTDLETGVVAPNPRGMPPVLVFSGNFACVYKVSVGGRTYAVRCFTREVKDQQTRYDQLSEYLINVLPPSFVYFEYVEHGINVRGSWYPIVKMDWVEGESLSSFVGSRLDDPGILNRLAAQWRGGPAASLRGLRIAHNDLQHGNVMVQVDGNIRLVDYDGIFLPSFGGQRSPELGHKNFQHPKRTPEDYGDYVDNFPSLVVYLSLLAIASDRGLWNDYYNDDNLIFTRNDYDDPGKSPLFDRLKKSPDQTVAKLAVRLEECCALPVKDVPDLETVLQGGAPHPNSAPLPPTTVPAAPSGATGQDYRSMLQAQPQTSTPPSPPIQPQAPATPPKPRTTPTPPTKLPTPPTGPTTPHAQPAWLARILLYETWVKLMLAGITVMFAGWLTLTGVGWLLIFAGVIVLLVFWMTKGRKLLIAGSVILAAGIVSLMVSAVWEWVVIPGAGVAMVGGIIGLTKVKRALARVAITAVLLIVSLVALGVVIDLVVAWGS